MEKIKELNIAIKDVSSGKNLKVVQPVNLYGCSFGDDCFVGPFVEVQKDVSIGSRVKIVGIKKWELCPGTQCLGDGAFAAARNAHDDIDRRHKMRLR